MPGVTNCCHVCRYGYERAAADECNTQCSSTSKRVQMRKYCDMDYVYLITVLGKEKADRKWTVFRCVCSFNNADRVQGDLSG